MSAPAQNALPSPAITIAPTPWSAFHRRTCSTRDRSRSPAKTGPKGPASSRPRIPRSASWRRGFEITHTLAQITAAARCFSESTMSHQREFAARPWLLSLIHSISIAGLAGFVAGMIAGGVGSRIAMRVSGIAAGSAKQGFLTEGRIPHGGRERRRRDYSQWNGHPRRFQWIHRRHWRPDLPRNAPLGRRRPPLERAGVRGAAPRDAWIIHHRGRQLRLLRLRPAHAECRHVRLALRRLRPTRGAAVRAR